MLLPFHFTDGKIKAQEGLQGYSGSKREYEISDLGYMTAAGQALEGAPYVFTVGLTFPDRPHGLLFPQHPLCAFMAAFIVDVVTVSMFVSIFQMWKVKGLLPLLSSRCNSHSLGKMMGKEYKCMHE